MAFLFLKVSVWTDLKLTLIVDLNKNLSKKLLVNFIFPSCSQIKSFCGIIVKLHIIWKHLFYKSTISVHVKKYNTECEYLHLIRN